MKEPKSSGRKVKTPPRRRSRRSKSIRRPTKPELLLRLSKLKVSSTISIAELLLKKAPEIAKKKTSNLTRSIKL